MQKEQLSALMDGETLDSELLNELAHNLEMKCAVIHRCNISTLFLKKHMTRRQKSIAM